jgi:hypothetical protein
MNNVQSRGKALVCRLAQASTRPNPMKAAAIKLATMMASTGIASSYDIELNYNDFRTACV